MTGTRRTHWSSRSSGIVRAMSNCDDIAESAAFIAVRDAARQLRRDGFGWGADDGYRMCPRGLHPDDEDAWLRGWRWIWS